MATRGAPRSPRKPQCGPGDLHDFRVRIVGCQGHVKLPFSMGGNQNAHDTACLGFLRVFGGFSIIGIQGELHTRRSQSVYERNDQVPQNLPDARLLHLSRLRPDKGGPGAARRLLGCSDRIPRRRVCPVGNGVQVAFTVPARKRVNHVWTYWGAVLGQLRPALAAQHRLGKRRRGPNPVQAVSSMA